MLDTGNITGTETILLVEDDDSVRSVIRRSLAHFGYTVLDAPGGEEALEQVRVHDGPVHLLLSDIMMPEMHGVEVAQAVQKLRPGVRVFYMSGYADQELVRQGLLHPDTHFLQKPFTPLKLARRVRQILDDEGVDDRS